MSAPDNPPAFPHLNPDYDGNWDKEPQRGGMTLRDWFAGQALVGALANPAPVEFPAGGYDEWIQGVAGNCFKVANAMLAARESRQ